MGMGGGPTFTFERHLIVSLIFSNNGELSQSENSHLDETSDEPVARESEDSKTHSPLPVWIKSSGTPFDDKWSFLKTANMRLLGG